VRDLAVYDRLLGTLVSAATGRPTSELAYLCRALKGPSLIDAAARLAERVRADAWNNEEYLAACLEREVATRQSHGGEARIKLARFPGRKTLDDFDYDHQRSVRREVIAHLAALGFVEARANVVFVGPPGMGKTHLVIALGMRACQSRSPRPFATAVQWVREARQGAYRGAAAGRARPARALPAVVIDEAGYIRSRRRPPTCSSSSSPPATSGRR
jgi:DNA replication protein DnaC